MDEQDTDVLTRELEEKYAVVEAAFQRKDLDAVADFFAPDFVVYTQEGDAIERDRVLDGFRKMMDSLSDISWVRTISNLEVQGDQAIATVQGVFRATFSSDDGQTHLLEHDLTSEDIWTRSEDGWHTRSARNLQRTERIDGRSPETAGPVDPSPPGGP